MGHLLLPTIAGAIAAQLAKQTIENAAILQCDTEAN